MKASFERHLLNVCAPKAANRWIVYLKLIWILKAEFRNLYKNRSYITVIWKMMGSSSA